MFRRRGRRTRDMMKQGGNNRVLETIFLITMVSLGWGLSFLALALLMEELAPMQVLAARWTITALIFLVLVLLGRIRINLRSRNVLFLFLAGLSEPCAYSILEAYGIKMTSASVSAIFVATVPSMTLILGILFFRHRADKKLVAGLVLAFLGVAIATVFSPTFSMSGTRTGMVLMTLAVVAASMYSLSSARASEDFDATAVTAMMAFEGAFLFDIICLAQGYGLGTFLLPFSSWKLFGGFLFLSVGCAFASYVCYNRLLSYIEAALATNVVGSLSTVIGVVAGVLVTGDVWGWYTVVGLAVTLAGVWLSGMRMKDDLGA